MLAGIAIVAAGAAIYAQTPADVVSARHVRIVPIKKGRLVSNPVLDAPGAFSGLREARGVEILGIVQTHAGVPVPNAGTVVIRELFSGTVAATTQVNDLAQFSLRSVAPGTYSAELLNRSGVVIASSPAFAARLGEIIQIAQTIPAPAAQGAVAMLRSATNAALIAAGSTGITALRPGAPLTPGS
jgi:hypothetical protein